jgi:hypothetical protein
MHNTNILNVFEYKSIYSKPKYTLAYVVRKGYFNLVRYLLNHGVDPNQLDDTDKTRRTSLIYCTFIKDDEWAISIAQNLLEFGASLKKADIKQLNPLHYCSTFGKEKLLEVFLNSLDFDFLNAVDLHGNTCLHYAIKFRNLGCLRLLLNKFRQYNVKDIELENYYGLLPTDILNLNERFEIRNNDRVTKEIDDKCLDMIHAYSKNMESQSSMQVIVNADSIKSILNRPKTAPFDSVSNKSGSSKDNKIESIEKITDNNKQKITFDTSIAACHTTVKKKPRYDSSLSPDYRLRPKSANMFANLHKNGRFLHDSVHDQHHAQPEQPHDLFLIAKHELLFKQIKYNDLCYAKENLVDQTVNYQRDYGTRLLDISDKQKSLKYLANIKVNRTMTSPLIRPNRSSTTLKLYKSQMNTGRESAASVKPGFDNISPQFRDNSFTVESQQNSVYFDTLDHDMDNVVDDVFSPVPQEQQQKTDRLLPGKLDNWRGILKLICTDLESKNSVSLRKTIRPPVSSLMPGMDMISCSASTKSTQRKSIFPGSSKTKSISRQPSVISSYSNSNNSRAFRRNSQISRF